MRTFTRLPALVLTVLLLSSCATNLNYQKAREAEQRREWDQAVVYYSQVLENDPDNIDVKLRLESARRHASSYHLERARELWDKEQYQDSMIEYRTARELDPLNRAAIIEFNQRVNQLEAMQEQIRKEEEQAQMAELESELEEAAGEEKPAIEINGDKKQSFYFPNREIGEIYQSLAKLAGINIIYHESVRQKLKQKTDFIINHATFWEAFDYFVQSNNHFYRTVREDTIMIIEGSRNNRQNFEDKVIKVFYLSNADVRDVFLAMRVVMPSGTKISQARTHNAIIMRDTPQKVAMASQLISILDKPKAEVIIDVEFLEVGSNVVNDVGILLSSYSSTMNFVNPNVTGDAATNVAPLDQLNLINKSNLFLTIPSMVYNFLKTSSNTKLLAKPQLRITDGEKSELHIGARVPVRKSTFNPGSAAGVGTPVDSYEYEDTGIKFTMTPRVHHNGEVSLDMEIEVSAIGAGADSTNPTFTTRNIKSKLRLKDGETNLLAGLIREEEKYDESGVAGLSDIPIIGKLFGKHRFDNGKTDIIITITPHIVRGGKLTLKDLLAIKSGPEINPGFEGMITMDELMNLRYLRGIPLAGRGAGGGSEGGFGIDEDEYYYEDEYYDEDEYYYEDEEEEDDEPPPSTN